MTNRETNLLERWRQERAMYDAWGLFVAEAVTNSVAEEVQPVSTELFFKIPIKHRTKEESSLLAKAFSRGKAYSDPYNDIEDKVGLRIVVLVTEEIRIVEKAILGCSYWNAAKARDFVEEMADRPFEFDYQSLHYILRSKCAFEHSGVRIDENLPCELQIRTILQHAYSELTHDTIYKPTVQAQADVKRAAAKSMALIEATDDYFMQVRQKLDKAEAPGRKVGAIVDSLYRKFTGIEPEPSTLNTLLIDHFKQWSSDDIEDDMTGFFEEKSFLVEEIRQRAPASLLFRQPAALLVYWAVKQAPRQAALDGPLTNDEIAPFYGDLGLRLPEAML